MKITKNVKAKSGQPMAARRRRRRRTYALSIPLSLRLRRSRTDSESRKNRTVEQVRSTGLTGSRLLAGVLVAATTALLLWFAIDTRFYAFEVEITGTRLVDAQAVAQASGLEGYSVFHIDTAAAAERIRTLVPGVERASVTCRLPDRLVIQVRESDVRFAWESGNRAFLVDRAGHVLQASNGTFTDLLQVRDLDAQPVEVGDTVDVAVLDTVEQLHGLMPEVRNFEYSQDVGVSLFDVRGWRIQFGDAEALPEKVASLNVLLQQISKRGEAVRLIDLRFLGSPYYE